MESKNVVIPAIRRYWPLSMPRFSFTHSLILLEDRVILAQRVALPFLGHEDAAHIRVPGELDAEHVEYFALQPVGGQVHVAPRMPGL